MDLWSLTLFVTGAPFSGAAGIHSAGRGAQSASSRSLRYDTDDGIRGDRWNRNMGGWECYHCKLWVDDGEPHDCWTTTEAALTDDLSEDLRDAWERLRETAVSFGDQRIYASHKSIMFSRKSCYFFVRPKRKFLEVCVFLGRTLKAPQVCRTDQASKSKIVHFIQIKHRDEVESPITDWLREAYHLSDELTGRPHAKRADKKRRP
jgi:Domain of unknown function (DUF5655)